MTVEHEPAEGPQPHLELIDALEHVLAILAADEGERLLAGRVLGQQDIDGPPRLPADRGEELV